MTARHPRTELAVEIGRLYDQVRSQLALCDPEAAERARAELIVVFECLVDEVAAMKRETKQNRGDALHGPGSDGRILGCLGIPLDHRAWKRLDATEARIKADAETRYIRVT